MQQRRRLRIELRLPKLLTQKAVHWTAFLFPALRPASFRTAYDVGTAPKRQNPGSLTEKPGFWTSQHEEPDDYLLSHGQSALSSAWSRFTVLFGMGRGGTDSLWSSGMTGCCVAGSAPQPIWKKRKEVFADWGCVVSGTTRDLSTPCVKHTGYRIKPYGQLVSVSLTHYCASTPDLSTSWSRTTLQGARSSGEVSS